MNTGTTINLHVTNDVNLRLAELHVYFNLMSCVQTSVFMKQIDGNNLCLLIKLHVFIIRGY